MIIIKYYMRKKYLCRVILTLIMVLIAVAVPIMYAADRTEADENESCEYLNVWQIDGFEGGRGSRKAHIERLAEKLFEGERAYCTVTALSAQAARENIAVGVIPDVISYPSSFYGIENLVDTRDFVYKIWCYGCYCILSLDAEADFNDVSANNTVINTGKDNLMCVCAALLGLNGAAENAPTNAYLQLLGGKCKYLLGTQRDIFRLETRKASYSVKAVGVFNDLYQNVSILTHDNKKYALCKRLVEGLELSDTGDLGLFGGAGSMACEELSRLNYGGAQYNLKGISSQKYNEQLISTAKIGDLKNLKNILR